ncbi:NT-3 growth factor receptor [Bagarius yarrelli]|uniref:NT-3 growth factor receptor n=1 Tax=Bagarius yarrelli TaxID=175774 RepID=A0A556VGU1_BAGYA|nr:NT-3 growth factor receptor [Bagarius yarrelli]
METRPVPPPLCFFLALAVLRLCVSSVLECPPTCSCSNTEVYCNKSHQGSFFPLLALHETGMDTGGNGTHGASISDLFQNITSMCSIAAAFHSNGLGKQSWHVIYFLFLQSKKNALTCRDAECVCMTDCGNQDRVPCCRGNLRLSRFPQHLQERRVVIHQQSDTRSYAKANANAANRALSYTYEI